MNGLKNCNGHHPMRRLTVGELPKEMIAVKREGREYRRQLERAVLDAHGEIDATAAHLIDSASACTIRAGIARWLLRNRLREMSVHDVLAATKAVADAKAARDKAVQALDLKPKPAAPWVGLIDVGSKR